MSSRFSGSPEVWGFLDQRLSLTSTKTPQNPITVLDNLKGRTDILQIPQRIRESDRFTLVIGDIGNEQLVLHTLKDRSVDVVIDCTARDQSVIDRSPTSGARNAIQGLTHLLNAIKGLRTSSTFSARQLSD
ncbi:hypothetical protein OSTOST_14876, partial [Ostertagia ostertagi]